MHTSELRAIASLSARIHVRVYLQEKHAPENRLQSLKFKRIGHGLDPMANRRTGSVEASATTKLDSSTGKSLWFRSSP